MNNQKIKHTGIFKLGLVKLAFLYCFICIAIVHFFEIFKPLRLEIIISLIACCIIPLIINFFDYQHDGSTQQEIKAQSLKLHLWAGLIFLVLVPFFSTDKISTLAYPLHHQAQRVQPLQNGYIELGEVRIPTYRQPVEGVVFISDTSQPVLCDLLSRRQCSYSEHFDQMATVQLSTRELWPYINRAVIFNFQTDQFQFNQAQHIQFYQHQKYAVLFYFVFIFLPSLWFFFKLRLVLINHYFKKVSQDNL